MGDRVPLAGLKMYPYNVRKKKEKNRGTDKTVRERLSSLFLQFKPRLDFFQNLFPIPSLPLSKRKGKKIRTNERIASDRAEISKEGYRNFRVAATIPAMFFPWNDNKRFI